MTEKLYQELAEWYDLLYCSAEQTKIETKFITQLLKKYGTKNVLDLGCGTGRHAIALTQEGFNVVGIDSSKHMIELAKKRAVGKTTFSVQSMEHFHLEHQIDAVISMFTSFAYITDPTDIIETLKNIHTHLTENGVLLIDTIYLWPSITEGKFKNKYVSENKNKTQTFIIEDENKLDPKNCILLTRATYKRKNGKTWLPVISEKEFQKIKLYTPDELTSLLHSNGFKVIKFFGDYSNSTLNSKHKRLIVLAKKA